uniref:Reverse transcriptase domain-containing protein n=1 Tax=Tanacetum cinerariifolium TaxID=118510 RepID=A0A699HXQ7_TANCI|nr:reverse transcriptase domain-containing protein [Tanacetum cinerariifolium]
MSAMANTTPIVTTVTKTANKEKTPNEADAALKANILDSCEEHYEDILLVIMDKIHCDKRKEVHVRLDFRENPRKRRRVREGSQNSSAGTLLARQSAFDRLSNTYSPTTTKSGPDRANLMDRSHSRGRPRRRDSSSSKDHPRSRGRPRGIEESYGNTCPSYGTWARHRYHNCDRDRSRSMKRGRESESSLSRVSNSSTSDGGHWKSKSKRRKPTGEEDLAVPWSCEEVETRRMKGAPECMRIFISMHGVSNLELTKRLNEHVLKTMEEMITATTTFIRGETATASKKKGHTSWKPQDQPKRHVSGDHAF